MNFINYTAITISFTMLLSPLILTAIHYNQAHAQPFPQHYFDNETAHESENAADSSTMPRTSITIPTDTNTTTFTTTTSTSTALNVSEIQFSRYENPEFGISIQHPSDWRVSETNPQPAQIVSFLSPWENLEDLSPVSVSIFQDDYASSVTLEGYTNLNSILYQELGVIISESKDTVLSGKPAHSVLVNNSSAGGTMDMLVWTVSTDGRKVYTIAYTATPDDFTRYLPVVQKMINSFQIIENQREDSAAQ